MALPAKAHSRIRRASGRRDCRRGAHSPRRQCPQCGARARRSDPVICASWCWSINAWRTPRSKPSSCGSTTPRPICARRCIAAIRDGVTPFRCSCCATRSARRSEAMRSRPRRRVSRSAWRHQAPAQTIVFRWGGDDSDREMDVIERDGKKISVPRYDDGRGDDCLEGEVATPAVLIEHAAAVACRARAGCFIADGSSVGCA